MTGRTNPLELLRTRQLQLLQRLDDAARGQFSPEDPGLSLDIMVLREFIREGQYDLAVELIDKVPELAKLCEDYDGQHR